jgi:hypothetical protein
MFAGEKDTHTEIVKSRNDFAKTYNMGESKLAATLSPSPVFIPEYLIGSSLLVDKQQDWQQARGCILQIIEEHESLVEEILPEISLRYLQ